MHTTRQIERLWNARQYDRLARELLTGRPEHSARLLTEVGRNVPAAALAVIRLDELSAAHHPLNIKLIRMILAAQEGDGGWGDPLTTALCVRALTRNRGQGASVDRALTYLAHLQKDTGPWPAVPIRRTTEDAFVTAFICFALGDLPPFHATSNPDRALHWLAQNEPTLDPDTLRLFHRATPRCRTLTLAHLAAN